MEAVADNQDPRTPGQVLAAERERQGLSRSEIAQRLHMSAYQVEALETGDYKRLPKGTFLRGFVRNYAKALGIPAESLLSRLAEASPRERAPGIVVPTQNIRFDPIQDRLANPYVKAAMIAFVVVSLALASMYWWVFIRPTPPAAEIAKKASSEPTPQNLAAAPISPPEPVLLQQAPTMDAPAGNAPTGNAAAGNTPPANAATSNAPATSAASSNAAAKNAAAVNAAANNLPTQPGSVNASTASAAPGEKTFRFRFAGESWIEIRDRNGKVLVSKLNPAGSESEISGRPPFNVIVGNAPQVQLRYDGGDFPLQPHTKVSVARFTVE